MLTLYQQDPKDPKRWIEVDLGRLNKIAAKEAEFLSLPSPINRTEHWRAAFNLHQSHIDPNGELASILEPGKTYLLRLVSGDLSVKRWAYSDRKQFVEDDGRLRYDSEAVRLVDSKPTACNARFTVVKSLPQPPRMEMKMRLCASYAFSDPAFTKVGSSTAMEVSIIITGSNCVTVQTRGAQRFDSVGSPST